MLTDVRDPHSVRDAIAHLSGVWGGMSMPILDIEADIPELERLGLQYDVDSLYADVVDGALGEFLRSPGWVWNGRGPWGPFGDEDHGGFRKGLLPAHMLVEPHMTVVQPVWDADGPDDLAYSAMFGISDRLGLGETRMVTEDVLTFAARKNIDGAIAGPLQATSALLKGRRRRPEAGPAGFYVIRSGNPTDAVEFWNLRILMPSLAAVPARCSPELFAALIRDLPHGKAPAGNEGATEGRPLLVWGLDDASDSVAVEIGALAARYKRDLWQSERGQRPGSDFAQLESHIKRAFRVECTPSAHSIDIELPTLPFVAPDDDFYPGVVAAEIRMHSIIGQDPRFTAQIPPFPRHSALIQRRLLDEGTEHARVSSRGQVLGVQATADHAAYTFALNLDVFDHLLGPGSANVSQSEVGKFQTRAADKLGGVFSGLLNQPGVRSAIETTATRREGIDIDHLRRLIEDNRGGWPGAFSRTTPHEYALTEVRHLFHTGFFIPSFRIHCSHCRVEQWVSADALQSHMQCEFCGDIFSLALSHALRKPAWRYRLAAHLREDQVQALLPAVATASLLRQLRHVEEPSFPVVLGLETNLDGSKCEVDVAAYIPDHEWLAVLGEVKSGNRITASDVQNIDRVGRHLAMQGVRSLSLYATLKDSFAAEEIAVLRPRAGRSKGVQTSHGTVVPDLPLVLTGPDLSHALDDRDHPWRWETESYAGIFGTAITSCKRNLGLTSYEHGPDGTVTCRWQE